MFDIVCPFSLPLPDHLRIRDRICANTWYRQCDSDRFAEHGDSDLRQVSFFSSSPSLTFSADSDQTTFKRGVARTRVIPLTVSIGQVTDVEIQFKKTANWISSAWYSASWTFTKATVLDGDQQQRSVSICLVDPKIPFLYLVDHSVPHRQRALLLVKSVALFDCFSLRNKMYSSSSILSGLFCPITSSPL